MTKDTFLRLMEAIEDTRAGLEDLVELVGEVDVEKDIFHLYTFMPDLIGAELGLDEIPDHFYEGFWEFVSTGSLKLYDEELDVTISLDSAEALWDEWATKF